MFIFYVKIHAFNFHYLTEQRNLIIVMAKQQIFSRKTDL